MDETEYAIALVTAERERQFELYGDQSGKSLYEFLAILGEEFGELCEAVSETYMMGSRHPERGGKDNIVREACAGCAYAPPSAGDGKPCTQCDESDPLRNCRRE